MPLRQSDVVVRDDLLRSPTDVEADVQFGGGQDRLFTGQRATKQADAAHAFVYHSIHYAGTVEVRRRLSSGPGGPTVAC